MAIRSDYLPLILRDPFSIPGSRGWSGAEVGHPGPCLRLCCLVSSVLFLFSGLDHGVLSFKEDSTFSALVLVRILWL